MKWVADTSNPKVTFIGFVQDRRCSWPIEIHLPYVPSRFKPEELVGAIVGLLNGEKAVKAFRDGVQWPATVKPCADGRWDVTWDHGVRAGHQWWSKGSPNNYETKPLPSDDLETGNALAREINVLVSNGKAITPKEAIELLKKLNV